MILFYFLLLLVFLSICVGFIWLSYWIPKRSGKRKIGVYLSSTLTLGLVILIFSYIFDDYLFFKSDARKHLSEINIELKDNFEIISNKDGGLMDYYHTFNLSISEADKNRLIEKIKDSKDYIDSIQNYKHLPSEAKDRYVGDTLARNYQTEREYKTELYYPNGQGYTPTYIKVGISKSKNELQYELILD